MKCLNYFSRIGVGIRKKKKLFNGKIVKCWISLIQEAAESFTGDLESNLDKHLTGEL